MFFAVLLLMGAATLVVLAVGPGCWLGCATTLAVSIPLRSLVTSDEAGKWLLGR